jgi:hypothetical protein
LSIVDYEHLVKFSKALDSTYPIKIYKTNGFCETEYGRILIEDKTLFDDLGKYGIVPNKSLNEKFPYMINTKYYIDVIRGIFDADGCISVHKSRRGNDEFEFNINGTKEILDSIREILGDVSNNKLLQRHPERDNNNYTLRHCGNLITYKYMSMLYENAEIYLERKYNKFLQLKELLNGRM